MMPGAEEPSWQDDWFDEFERMAERRLGDGSACEQIHPIVERWFTKWLESDVKPPRSAVVQALACLTTEVLNIAPPTIINALMEHCDEDAVAEWVEHILATGQAFQAALDNGELDDL